MHASAWSVNRRAASGKLILLPAAMAVAAPGLLVFLLCLSVAQSLTSSEWDLAWEKAEAKCVHLMRLKTVGKKALTFKFNDVSRRTKCFISCFFDEVGLTNGTEINEELYTGWLKEELARSIRRDATISSVKKCVASIKRIEKCETAFALFNCLEI